jgi:hypothetical protein
MIPTCMYLYDALAVQSLTTSSATTCLVDSFRFAILVLSEVAALVVPFRFAFPVYVLFHSFRITTKVLDFNPRQARRIPLLDISHIELRNVEAQVKTCSDQALGPGTNGLICFFLSSPSEIPDLVSIEQYLFVVPIVVVCEIAMKAMHSECKLLGEIELETATPKASHAGWPFLESPHTIFQLRRSSWLVSSHRSGRTNILPPCKVRDLLSAVAACLNATCMHVAYCMMCVHFR